MWYVLSPSLPQLPSLKECKVAGCQIIPSKFSFPQKARPLKAPSNLGCCMILWIGIYVLVHCFGIVCFPELSHACVTNQTQSYNYFLFFLFQDKNIKVAKKGYVLPLTCWAGISHTMFHADDIFVLFLGHPHCTHHMVYIRLRVYS